MFGFTEQLSQGLGIMCAPLAPANRAGNTATNITGWVAGPLDMGIFRRAWGVVNVGAILGAGASNTVNAQFLAGSLTNTSQVTNVLAAGWTWNTITNGANVSISTNNNFATIEIRADQLPAGTRYLALLVNNNSAAFFDGWLLGGQCAYSPGGVGNSNQLNTVQGLTQAIT